jgi:predicted nucleotidyltransferase
MDKSILTKDDILSVLRQQENVLHKQFSIKTIGIFGSFARNEATELSDIDFLVDFEEGNLDYYSIVRDLRDFLVGKFNRDIDIAFRKSLKPYFRETILKQAIYA